jgi:hypothetical protein
VKKFTPRQIARGQMSNAAFRRGLPSQEKESCDSDYVEALPPEARTWMRTFEQEYYGGRFEKGGVRLHKGELKKECARRLRRHRFDRAPDIMSKGTRIEARSFDPDYSLMEELYGSFNPEGDYMAALDGEVFARWKLKNSNSLREAKALFKNLVKTRNRVRIVKLARALVISENEMYRNANRSSYQGQGNNANELNLANGNSSLHQESLKRADAWGMVTSFCNSDSNLV